MKAQNIEELPNVVILSLKYQKPLQCIGMTGTHRAPYATIWTPIKVDVFLFDTLLEHRRDDIRLIDYDRIKEKYLSYIHNK